METKANAGEPDPRARVRAVVASALQQVERSDRSGSTRSFNLALASAAAPGSDTIIAGLSLPSVTIPGYTLVRELHRGGQGVVYQGFQLSTQRRVAIKIMRDGPLATGADRARFEREIQILAQLRHPNIVAIHDSGRSAEHDFYVMDLVDGKPLDVHVHAVSASLGARPRIEATLRLFAKVCHAANAAHLRGVIHRDLKPRNVLVDSAGEPRVLDFGVARFVDADANESTQGFTAPGQFVGSLPWSSPEQAEGLPIDIRTDVYSLGVMLYQALTGRFPYPVTGRASEIISRIRSQDPTRPNSIVPSLDGDLSTLVLKCLAKTPDRRYQSAGDLARDIEHYLAGEPIEARRDSALYLARKTIRRFRAPLAILAGFVLLLLLSSIVSWNLYLKMRRFAAAEKQANVEATENLWHSYLDQARLRHASGTAGHRLETLALVEKAAKIRPSIELRNQAIAALALTDLRVLPPFTTVGESSIWADKAFRSFAIQDKSDPTRILDPIDGHALWSLPDARPSQALAFAPSGRFLQICDAARAKHRVWSIPDARVVLEIDGSPADWVRFSPDSRLVALSNETAARVRIYDVEAGAPRGEFSVAPGLYRFEFSTDGQRLVVFSQNTSHVEIYQLAPQRLINAFDNTEHVTSMAWDAASGWLACGGSRGRIDIWNPAEQTRIAALLGHSASVIHLGFNADGRRLFSEAWDGTSRWWDVAAERELFRTSGKLLALRGDGTQFLLGAGSAGGKNALSLADIVEPTGFAALIGPTPARTVKRDAALSPDGRLLLTAAFHADDEPNRGGLRIYDTVAEKQIAFLDIGDTRCVQFDSAGRSFFCSGVRGFFRWPLHRDGSTLRVGPPQRLSDDTGRFDFAPDGRTCAILGGIGRWILTILDVDRPANCESFDCQVGAAYIDVSPDGQQVAVGTWNGYSVEVWDLPTRRRVYTVDTAASASVAFVDNRRLIYDDSAHQMVELDTETWAEQRRVDILAHGFRASPDGRYLAASGWGSSRVYLWEARTLELIAEFESPDNLRSGALAFAADSCVLAIATEIASVSHLWDLRALRTELARLGLDWDQPTCPPLERLDAAPLKIEVDLGEVRIAEVGAAP